MEELQKELELWKRQAREKKEKMHINHRKVDKVVVRSH